MAQKHTRPRPPAEFRHRSQLPLPAVEEVEQRLTALLSPSLLAPRQLARRDPRPPQRRIRMRPRLLTRPGMGALIGRLGWRRWPGGAQGQRVLAREGLLGGTPWPGSAQAILKRRDGLPVAPQGQRVADVCARLQAPVPAPGPHPRGALVREHFPPSAMGDGSTLAALRNTTQRWQEHGGWVLGGPLLGRVEACSHRPLGQRSTEDAAAHAKRCAAEIRAALPLGGLWVFALGFVSFLGGDDCTASHRFFVTRLRQQTA